MASFRSLQSLRAIAQLARQCTGPPPRRSFHSSRVNAGVYPNADIATFEKAVAASQGRIVLVDFYSDSCPPCRQLSPILEKLASDESDAGRLPIDLVKIDTETDEGQELGAAHMVRYLPTVVAYKDGQAVNQFIGAIPIPEINKFLDTL